MEPAVRGTAPTSRFAATSSSRIAPAIAEPAKQVIDAGGQAVTPGFIDIHNHARENIFKLPSADNYIRQGVTTIIEGPDGGSPVPLAPFLAEARDAAEVDQHRKLCRTGIRTRSCARHGEQTADTCRARQNAVDRRGRHEGGGIRPEHRPLLRAGRVHADRRSDRARARRGPVRRHSHLTHARRGVRRARQRARDDSHRRGRRAADAGNPSQDRRAEKLWEER